MDDETNIVSKRSTRTFRDEDCCVDFSATSSFRDLAAGKTLHGHEDIQTDKESDSETPTPQSSHSSSSSIYSLDLTSNLSGETVTGPAERSHGAGKDHIAGKPKKTPGIPINFGTVIPGVYRSAYPQTEDYEFLGSLKLKTLVTLVSTPQPEGFQVFIQENGIKHIVIVMQGTKKAAISLPVMMAIMEVLLDRENHPILMHCNQGKHRTGCVVAVLRKVMGWHVDDAVSEYSKYAFPKERETDLNYIRNFKVDILSDVIRKSQLCKPSLQWPSIRYIRAGQCALFGAMAMMIWLASGMKFWY